MKRVSMKK